MYKLVSQELKSHLCSNKEPLEHDCDTEIQQGSESLDFYVETTQSVHFQMESSKSCGHYPTLKKEKEAPTKPQRGTEQRGEFVLFIKVYLKRRRRSLGTTRSFKHSTLFGLTLLGAQSTALCFADNVWRRLERKWAGESERH